MGGVDRPDGTRGALCVNASPGADRHPGGPARDRSQYADPNGAPVNAHANPDLHSDGHKNRDGHLHRDPYTDADGDRNGYGDWVLTPRDSIPPTP